MFKSAKIITFILGLLLLAITCTIGHWCVESIYRTNEYWVTLLAIMLAELFLVLSFMNIGDNHDDKSAVWGYVNIEVSIAYIIFTLIMIIPYLLGAALKGLLIFQLLGIFAALAFQSMLGLAHKTSSTHDEEVQKLQANKKEFNNSLNSIKLDLDSFFTENKLLEKKFNRLSDLVRFAPESFDGCEELDRSTFELIEELKNSISVASLENIEKNILLLSNNFIKRQHLSKTNRKGS